MLLRQALDGTDFPYDEALEAVSEASSFSIGLDSTSAQKSTYRILSPPTPARATPRTSCISFPESASRGTTLHRVTAATAATAPSPGTSEGTRPSVHCTRPDPASRESRRDGPAIKAPAGQITVVAERHSRRPRPTVSGQATAWYHCMFAALIRESSLCTTTGSTLSAACNTAAYHTLPHHGVRATAAAAAASQFAT